MFLKQSIVFLILAGFSTATADYTERECPCSANNDGYGLWLDISVAIDVSDGMGDGGKLMVIGDLGSVFPSTSIGNDQGPVPGQVTRIAINTYNTRSVQQFNLSAFQSNDDFQNSIWNLADVSTSSSVANLKAGLAGALAQLANGRADGTRNHVHQAIIVYASDCDDTAGENDPTQVANEIKASGISIITVAFEQSGNTKLGECLNRVASPGMAFSNVGDLVGQIQKALCQVNCFCPNEWSRFTSNGKDFGSCIRLGNIQAIFNSAKHVCANLGGGIGYIVNEFNEEKHNFTVNLAKSDPTFKPPHTFYIGLSNTNGNWFWEQPTGSEHLSLVEPTGNYGWCTGYPDNTQNANCASETPVDSEEKQFCWTNTVCTVAKNYICERPTCDVQNYCA